MDIVHLDNHKVSVTREKITWPGARIRKKGEGMPNYENNNLHGNLYITFDVEFPKKDLDDTEKEGKFQIIIKHFNEIIKFNFLYLQSLKRYWSKPLLIVLIMVCENNCKAAKTYF